MSKWKVNGLEREVVGQVSLMSVGCFLLETRVLTVIAIFKGMVFSVLERKYYYLNMEIRGSCACMACFVIKFIILFTAGI